MGICFIGNKKFKTNYLFLFFIASITIFNFNLTKSVFDKLKGGASLAAFAKLKLEIVIDIVKNKNK